MTLATICDKIGFLLETDIFAPCIDTASEESKLDAAMIKSIDMALRKIARDTKCLRREAALTFTAGSDGKFSAEMPDGLFAIDSRDGIYACDGRLFSDKAGTYTFVYYVYPTAVTGDTASTYEPELDDYACDAAAYAAAAELCGRLYPGDNARYMRLMTEYDDRMVRLYEKNIKNTLGSLFSAGRGVIRK